MTNRTRALAEFAVGTDYDSFGPELIAAAIRPIIDTVAVLYAGYSGDAGQTLLKHAAANPAPASHSGRVVGSPDLHTNPDTAALTNGTLGHALDYDDVLAGYGHPSVPLVGSLLALPPTAPLSGRDLIAAYIIGHEVWVRIAAALGPLHYRSGWHNTSTAGSFGTAAAVGRLKGLSVEQMTTAFGIVASMSSGLQRNFGTMTKPLQAGIAARNGVLAVELAQIGLTASDNVLEGHKGYLDIYGHGSPEPERLDILGNPWALLDPGPSLKKYPCCYATHRGIDAVLQLQNDHDIDPDTIDSITCTTPPGAMGPLLYDRPRTPLEAKFSMQYNLAAAFIDRRVTLAAFTPEAVRREDILRLIPKVHASENPANRPEDPERKDTNPGTGGFIEVTVKAGGLTASAVSYVPTGSPSKPLTDEELAAKFEDCLGFAGIDAGAASDALARLVELPDLTDINPVLNGLKARIPQNGDHT